MKKKKKKKPHTQKKNPSHCRNSSEIQSHKIVEIEVKSIPITHIYMTVQFPGMIQALQ